MQCLKATIKKKVSVKQKCTKAHLDSHAKYLELSFINLLGRLCLKIHNLRVIYSLQKFQVSKTRGVIPNFLVASIRSKNNIRKEMFGHGRRRTN